MKKIYSLLFIAAVVFSFNTQSFSQPKLTIDVNGGYGAPLGDFKVDVPTDERADADEFPYYTKGATCWVDVKDVVRIMIALMNSSITNERFIVSTGNYSYHEVFMMMAMAMKKKAPYKLASPFMSELVWRFEYLKSMLTGKTATITKETAKSAHTIKRFDNSKLVKALHDFRYANIEESIKRISVKYI